MGFAWNKYKASEGSRYFKFGAIGDTIEGELLTVEEGKDFNGRACPELTIETEDGPKTVTCSQVVLQSALAEKEPAEGEHITITYYADGDKKPGKMPAKLFKVDVRRGAPTPAADGNAAVGADDLI